MSYTEKSKSKKAKPARPVKKVIIPLQKEVAIQLKAETPKVRYLKVKAFSRESRSTALIKPRAKIVPQLRLCGLWLQKAGFNPDEYVNITVMDGILIIRSAQEQ